MEHSNHSITQALRLENQSYEELDNEIRMLSLVNHRKLFQTKFRPHLCSNCNKTLVYVYFHKLPQDWGSELHIIRRNSRTPNFHMPKNETQEEHSNHSTTQTTRLESQNWTRKFECVPKSSAGSTPKQNL